MGVQIKNCSCHTGGEIGDICICPKLGANANVTNFTTGVAGAIFDLNTHTLSISTTYNNTTNAGTLTANGAGSTLILNGASAQSFTVGTYTGTLKSNLEIANANS